MKKKVLIISTSLRGGSNSEILAKECEKGAKAAGHDVQFLSLKEKEGDTSLLSAQYTLLPVWAVRYDYRDSEYTFLMNGQTGKVAGNPPLSLPKLAVGFGLIATFLFIFLRIFTALLGGPVL